MFKIVRKTDLAKSEQQIRELREDRRRLTAKLFSSVPYEQHSAVLTARNRVIHEQRDRLAQLERHNDHVRTANTSFYLGNKAPLDAVVHGGKPLTYRQLRKVFDAQTEVNLDLLDQNNRLSKSNTALIREVEGLKRALREAKAASLKVVPEIGYECTYRHTCVFKKEAL